MEKVAEILYVLILLVLFLYVVKKVIFNGKRKK